MLLTTQHSIVLKTIFMFVLTVHSVAVTSQQASPDELEYYKVAPNRLNNDRTLKLAYIKQSYDNTTLYVTYTCANKATAFSGLYLNNLRIVDKATGKIYTATNTWGLPTRTDSKFFLYNLGAPMMLRIDFARLPLSVKTIDVLEGTGTGTETYNFTFKNVNVGGSYQMTATEEDEFGNYLGKLEKYIVSPTYTPNCYEDGTFTVCFSKNEKRRLYATAKTTANTFTWNFEFTPGASTMSDTDCSVMKLKTK